MSPRKPYRRRWRRRTAAVAGAILLAAPLGAQTRPGPPPSAPVDAVDPDAARRPETWDYAVGTGFGWDGNVDVLVPDGPSDAAFVPRAGVSRVFATARRQLRATAVGRWTSYPDHPDLRRYDTELVLDVSQRRSAATTLRANASYGLGDSGSSRILVEQGVALPIVKTRSLAAAAGLTHRTGAHTLVRADARDFRTDFDTKVLVDGESARGTVALERQLRGRGTAALEYSLEQVQSDQHGRRYRTHFASLQWSRVLSPHSAVLLEAGASYTADAAAAGLEREESFFGGASYTRTVRRSSLALFVRREVTPAFGIGVSRLATRAGVGATLPLRPDWEARVVASHLQPDADPERRYGSSDDAFLAVGRSLGRHLELSCEARYRRRAETPRNPQVEALQAGVFLTWLSPSARARDLLR